jgi:hypothetical protein
MIPLVVIFLCLVAFPLNLRQQPLRCLALAVVIFLAVLLLQ